MTSEQTSPSDRQNANQFDDEATSVARTGRADPDAGPSAEEAAVHVIEPG